MTPGTRPIHGDTAHVFVGTVPLLFTGSITCQGVLEKGRGYVELTLPDADPEQRRLLERSTTYQWELHRDGRRLYSSPLLALHSTRRSGTGSLVVKGAPTSAPPGG
ncbi:hypothetical protein [Streptomyces sp. NPDC059783]|uniref:hypothetical protein n=1 Tax=Streptomyces sp. NPDC059783 TaxID=3346944 RepID=UPI00365DED75